MLLKDCATYVSDRIDSIHLSDTTYISTDNMLPDRRGIEPSSCVPNKGNVTAFKPGDILLSNIIQKNIARLKCCHISFIWDTT